MREALISLLMTFHEFIILDSYKNFIFASLKFFGKNMKVVNRISKPLPYIDGSLFLRIGMCINKKIFKNVIKWVS